MQGQPLCSSWRTHVGAARLICLLTGCLVPAVLQSFNGTNFTTPAQYNEFLKEHKNVFACEFVSSAWRLLSMHTRTRCWRGSGVPMAHGTPWRVRVFNAAMGTPQRTPATQPSAAPPCAGPAAERSLPLSAALDPYASTTLPPPLRPGINNQLLLAMENSTDLSLNVDSGNYTEAGVRPSAIDSRGCFFSIGSARF